MISRRTASFPNFFRGLFEYHHHHIEDGGFIDGITQQDDLTSYDDLSTQSSNHFQIGSNSNRNVQPPHPRRRHTTVEAPPQSALETVPTVDTASTYRLLLQPSSSDNNKTDGSQQHAKLMVRSDTWGSFSVADDRVANTSPGDQPAVGKCSTSRSGLSAAHVSGDDKQVITSLAEDFKSLTPRSEVLSSSASAQHLSAATSQQEAPSPAVATRASIPRQRSSQILTALFGINTSTTASVIPGSDVALLAAGTGQPRDVQLARGIDGGMTSEQKETSTYGSRSSSSSISSSISGGLETSSLSAPSSPTASEDSISSLGAGDHMASFFGFGSRRRRVGMSKRDIVMMSPTSF